MASGSRPRMASGADNVHQYRMHVSQKYLDLTKQKLEIARLPREPQSTYQRWDCGVAKSYLEPLIDHWLEGYDWRQEETRFNNALPQFRTVINGTRIHFVHRRSASPNAIPLLFVHGFPESFITVEPMIDALCDPPPMALSGDESVPAFHVVAPSIPGFGFSDPVSEEGNSIPTTAAILDALMKTLGYMQYIVHGSGWAFRVCRMLAIGHGESCIAIHTVNPDVPAPRSSFGYINDDTVSGMAMRSPGNAGMTPPFTPGVFPYPAERPQTLAYALCDSPTGLLAYMLDLIQPQSGLRSPQSPQIMLGPPSAVQTPGAYSPGYARSPSSPASVRPTAPGHGRSPHNSQTSQPMLELGEINNPWKPTAIITWTLLYWFPGPEIPLRWISNSAALTPSLWLTHSTVPLGITHFRDPISSSTGAGQTPPQWCEAYHRVAMVRRREGRVRFPAWERPAEVVMDLRELAGILGASVVTSTSSAASSSMAMPPPSHSK